MYIWETESASFYMIFHLSGSIQTHKSNFFHLKTPILTILFHENLLKIVEREMLKLTVLVLPLLWLATATAENTASSCSRLFFYSFFNCLLDFIWFVSFVYVLPLNCALLLLWTEILFNMKRIVIFKMHRFDDAKFFTHVRAVIRDRACFHSWQSRFEKATRSLATFVRSHRSLRSLAPQRSASLRSLRSLPSQARSLTSLTPSWDGWN